MLKKENKTVILSNLLLSNVGCEIILRGTIAFLEKRLSNYQLNFIIPSYQYEYDSRLLSDITNVRVVPMIKWKRYIRGALIKLGLFTKYWTPRFESKHFKNSDLFVSVGGDIYTMFSNKLPEDWIGYESFATKNNIPSLMFGANMEKFEIVSKSDQVKLIEHLKRFESIFVRDFATKKYLESYSVKSNVSMFPDPIFSLRRQTQFDKKRIRSIGINFTPILIRDYGDEIVDKYACLITSLIEQGYSISLIPHVYSTTNNDSIDDKKAMDLVLEKISSKYRNGIEVFSEVCTLKSVEKKISEIDLFIGARMHGCLNSLTLGKSVIFLAYSSKAHTMVETLSSETPFKSASMCYTAIDAEKINVDEVNGFIRRHDEWVDSDGEAVVVNTEEYLDSLQVDSIVSNIFVSK